MNILSDKVFHIPTGGTSRASIKAKLTNELREPATEVDISPVLTNTLLSTGKLLEGGYFTVYDENEVNIYDGKKRNNNNNIAGKIGHLFRFLNRLSDKVFSSPNRRHSQSFRKS